MQFYNLIAFYNTFDIDLTKLLGEFLENVPEIGVFALNFLVVSSALVRGARYDEFRQHFENPVVPPHILFLEEILVHEEKDVVFGLLLVSPSSHALSFQHLHFSLVLLLSEGKLALKESLLGFLVELEMGALLQHGLILLNIIG